MHGVSPGTSDDDERIDPSTGGRVSSPSSIAHTLHAANEASRGTSISLVVPVFDEEATILPFLESIGREMQWLQEHREGGVDYEIVFVNDGSGDGTAALVRSAAAHDPRIRLVNLSRNFGKEAALSAGLRFSSGAVVIPIDCDLQDPPQLIRHMLQRWDEGFLVVNGVREDRAADSFAKRTTARAFYRVYNLLAERPIEPDAGDFRLMDRKVVSALLQMDERFRFNKALFSWVGFRTCSVPYRREERVAGTSKWRYWRLWNLAIDGVTSSTTLPLRMWTYVGALVASAAFLYASFIIVHAFAYGIDVPGYASLMCAILFMGGVNLLSLGVLGEYLGRVSTEVRRRPLYIVDSTTGL